MVRDTRGESATISVERPGGSESTFHPIGIRKQGSKKQKWPRVLTLFGDLGFHATFSTFVLCSESTGLSRKTRDFRSYDPGIMHLEAGSDGNEGSAFGEVLQVVLHAFGRDLRDVRQVVRG